MTVTIELSDEQAADLRACALTEGVSLSELVQQLVDAHAREGAILNNDRPIWEVIVDNMRDVSPEEFEKLPKDGAGQVDHYLYGRPKR